MARCKGGLGPGADAGLGIGRDVGRVNHAERGCHGIAAGEFLPAVGSVALRAIAAAGKSFALGDQFRREASRGRRRDRRDRRPPRQRAEAYEPETSECNDSNDQLSEHGILQARHRSAWSPVRPQMP